MKRFKYSIFLLAFLIPVTVSNLVSAQFTPLEESCDTLSATERAKSDVCRDFQPSNETNPVTGTDGIILRVADILAIIGGVIAVIIVIVAGITMMTSSGDSSKVQNSRNAIIYAVVGIIVIVLARSIVIFVINQTG